MKQVICSFCGKGEDSVSSLVLAGKGPSSAAICNECLEVCGKVLANSGTELITDPPKTSPTNSQKDSPKNHYRIGPQPPEPRRLICSFCGSSMHKTRHLIGSAAGLPQTYICGECVAVAIQESKVE